jgi:hypothetical protein
VLDFTLFIARRSVPQYRTQYALTGSYMAPYHHILECRHLTEQAQILKRACNACLRNKVR